MISLALCSHTNVGKTTLLRTLLRRDVGMVLDHEHVTDVSEAFQWLKRGDLELRLWDTPGFGNSVQLSKRIRERTDNGLEWFLAQSFDRQTDRAFWCNQQALRTLYRDTDVVLYLLDAEEKPGYLGTEMTILTQIGKPVLMLANKIGESRSPLQIAEYERSWQKNLETWPIVRGVLVLDAFARCWVMEDRLLEAVEEVLPNDRQDEMHQLRSVWRDENLAVFRKAMNRLGRQLADSALDGEPEPEERKRPLLARLTQLGQNKETEKALAKAREKMAGRLEKRQRAAMDDLISLHGIEGRSSHGLEDLADAQLDKPEGMLQSLRGMARGALVGGGTAVAGDLATGGISFGTVTLTGTILGAAAGYLHAQYNLSKTDHKLYWSFDHFREQVRMALVRYLAVAHYGRGLGAWTEGELPQDWTDHARDVVRDKVHAAWIAFVWKNALRKDSNRKELETQAGEGMETLARLLLEGLYPECRVFLG